MCTCHHVDTKAKRLIQVVLYLWSTIWTGILVVQESGVKQFVTWLFAQSTLLVMIVKQSQLRNTGCLREMGKALDSLMQDTRVGKVLPPRPPVPQAQWPTLPFFSSCWQESPICVRCCLYYIPRPPSTILQAGSMLRNPSKASSKLGQLEEEEAFKRLQEWTCSCGVSKAAFSKLANLEKRKLLKHHDSGLYSHGALETSFCLA